MKFLVRTRNAHKCTPPMVLAALLMALSQSADAYGLLTHQQTIDACWQSTIVPLLLTRYPSLTPQQLMEAHAYAYGGSVIQDLGYYPFSNAFFSDLTHYVRTGDFVRSLFHNSHNADEVAFAIGALAHYLGDSIGHSQATNPSVALAFPKLAKKYGPSVSYADGKTPHIQVEWAFDVRQAARRRVAPYDYVGHIGFSVPWEQLAAAFAETYGFPLHDILGYPHQAQRSYRFGARHFIPKFTYAEVLVHSDGLPGDIPNPESALFERRTVQLALDADWNRYRKNPGVGTHMLAGLIAILPKVGPLKALAIKGPTEAGENLYIESVNLTTTAIILALTRLGAPEPPPGSITDLPMAEVIRKENAAFAGKPLQPAEWVSHLTARDLTLSASLVPNRDLDTGKRVVPGGYVLTDQTYAKLLAKLIKDPSRPMPEALRHDILDYYADDNAPISTKKDKEKWAQLQKHLVVLMSMSSR